MFSLFLPPSEAWPPLQSPSEGSPPPWSPPVAYILQSPASPQSPQSTCIPRHSCDELMEVNFYVNLHGSHSRVLLNSRWTISLCFSRPPTLLCTVAEQTFLLCPSNQGFQQQGFPDEIQCAQLNLNFRWMTDAFTRSLSQILQRYTWTTKDGCLFKSPTKPGILCFYLPNLVALPRAVFVFPIRYWNELLSKEIQK